MKIKTLLRTLKPYLVSCFISLGVGIISAVATSGSMDIYDRIAKPTLSPPSILFPIVWTVLYILMGISAARIYLNRELKPVEVKDALSVYGMSLVANFVWSIIFFNFGAFIVSFVWLLLLLSLIVAYTIRYFAIDKPSAFLQIPYIAWVAFAGYLNFAIFLLNS